MDRAFLQKIDEDNQFSLLIEYKKMNKDKTLIIVESPGKIHTIQKYLGDKYIVLATAGHIVDLAKNGRFGLGVNVFDNFKTYYTLIPEKIQFLDKIINASEECNKIIICSDPDLEGTGIAYLLAEKLVHLNKPILRAEFHEITQFGIEDGLKHQGKINQDKFKAQATRRIIDRLFGFMISPYLANYYKSNVSAGRVQSVATLAIVDREDEILKFKPEEYWNLNLSLSKKDKSFIAKYQGKIKNKDEANTIKNDLLASNTFKVSSVIAKPKKELPDPPLTTSRLQQIMYSKYGVSGEETMEHSQILYEYGFCSYIRTDSMRISDTALSMVRGWLTDQKFDVPKQPNIFKNKNSSQDAHECLRPTVIKTLPSQIEVDEIKKLIYKEIWYHFVASQMNPAIYDTLEIKINHISNNYLFKASGKALRYQGYLELSNTDVGAKMMLPSLNKDEELTFSKKEDIQLEQKFTQPPSRYNYASLIKFLERKGIGRPSTFSTILAKITDRNYVEKKNDALMPTELGRNVSELLKKYFDFMRYDYTASLEEKLDDIAIGKANDQQILHDFFDQFKRTLIQAHLDAGGEVCERCQLPVFHRQTKEGIEYIKCLGAPFCKKVKMPDINHTSTLCA